MSENLNEFVVDLGTLKLSEEQRSRINASIQKAVAGELANISMTERFIMIPANPGSRFPGWNHWYGITARLVDETLLAQLAAQPGEPIETRTGQNVELAG
jgi:hypothetical protein